MYFAFFVSWFETTVLFTEKNSCRWENKFYSDELWQLKAILYLLRDVYTRHAFPRILVWVHSRKDFCCMLFGFRIAIVVYCKDCVTRESVVATPYRIKTDVTLDIYFPFSALEPSGIGYKKPVRDEKLEYPRIRRNVIGIEAPRHSFPWKLSHFARYREKNSRQIKPIILSNRYISNQISNRY